MILSYNYTIVFINQIKKQRDKNMSLVHFLGHDNYGKPGNCEDGGPWHGSTINVNPASPGIYNIFI